MVYRIFAAPRTNNGVQAYYHQEVSSKCEKAFMSTDAFRVLLRSIGGGSRAGRIVNEDGVQLYGWRVMEKDGTLSAIITDVVESSHKSRRTAVTFDVDYEYAIHRDRFIRDMRNHRDYNLLGFFHSHPHDLRTFSSTDIDTMAEYTRSDMEVMLSGLVTLEDGRLRLTMYAVTQSGRVMDIWHLPLVISDGEVERRMPRCTPKSFEQVWCEASGASRAPDFSAIRIRAEAPAEKRSACPADVPKEAASDKPETELNGMVRANPAKPAPEIAPEDLRDSTGPFSGGCDPIASGEEQEGKRGFLRGIMRNGELHMQSAPAAGIPRAQPEPGCAGPVDPPVTLMYQVSVSYVAGGLKKRESWESVAFPDDPGPVPVAEPPARGMEGGGEEA